MATAAFSLCLVICAGATVACSACVALYGLQLYNCDSARTSCWQSAGIDYYACLAGCPTTCSGLECETPIVINLDGRQGFKFTSVADGVRFDLDGDGSQRRTAWTAPGHGQAFLALDRNDNGLIDDGTELFGGVTAQPSLADPNGYLALAVFDDVGHGGNGDGVIGREDAIFDVVRLWIDSNHDGVSQPEELISLHDAGVEHLNLDFVVSNRRDPHGNVMRYKSLVRLTGRVVESVDVLFLQGL